MTETSPHELQSSRVLVTGGTGFIGAHLCARLAAAGAQVTALSRRPGTAGDGVETVSADLCDAQATRRALEQQRPDLVFHLASHVVGARSVEAVAPTFASNLESTVNLLVAAHEVGCSRVILTGSMEEPDPSDDWPVPNSPYAAAKAAAAGYGRMFDALFDLPVVLLRLFMVYGPRQSDHAKLVPYVITSLLNGGAPRLSSGTREVDWVFVEDVVEAYVAAATKPGIRGNTIDVGSGCLSSVRSVVEQIYSIMNVAQGPVFGGVADRPMEQTRCADVSRTESILGWRASTGLREGLSATIAWYASQQSKTKRHAH